MIFSGRFRKKKVTGKRRISAARIGSGKSRKNTNGWYSGRNSGPLTRKWKLRGKKNFRGKINYFVGSRQNWRSNIPPWRKLSIKISIRGSTWSLTSGGGNPAFSYRVHPGADPGRLIFDYQGVDELRLKPSGELVIITRFGGFLSPPPRAYQKIEGKETEGGIFVPAPKRQLLHL